MGEGDEPPPLMRSVDKFTALAPVAPQQRFNLKLYGLSLSLCHPYPFMLPFVDNQGLALRPWLTGGCIAHPAFSVTRGC